MKEKTSMNQKRISVMLKALDENTDVLDFSFENENITVNLNSEECQQSLKKVFVGLLQELVSYDVELVFSSDDGYNRHFYMEACEEYIKDLNRELNSIKTSFREEINS